MEHRIIENVRDLREYWKTVDPKTVYPNLALYFAPCGTLACLLGHAYIRHTGGANIPNGFYKSFAGLQRWRADQFGNGTHKSFMEIFPRLFSGRMDSPYDAVIIAEHPDCSDWFLAAKRLDMWLAEFDPQPVVQTEKALERA